MLKYNFNYVSRKDRNAKLKEMAPYFFTTWNLTFDKTHCYLEDEDDTLPGAIIMEYYPKHFRCTVEYTQYGAYLRMTNKQWYWDSEGTHDIGMNVDFSYTSFEELEEDFASKLAWFIEEQGIE